MSNLESTFPRCEISCTLSTSKEMHSEKHTFTDNAEAIYKRVITAMKDPSQALASCTKKSEDAKLQEILDHTEAKRIEAKTKQDLDNERIEKLHEEHVNIRALANESLSPERLEVMTSASSFLMAKKIADDVRNNIIENMDKIVDVAMTAYRYFPYLGSLKDGNEFEQKIDAILRNGSIETICKQLFYMSMLDNQVIDKVKLTINKAIEQDKNKKSNS